MSLKDFHLIFIFSRLAESFASFIALMTLSAVSVPTALLILPNRRISISMMAIFSIPNAAASVSTHEIVSVLSKEIEWISSVYEKTCGYVHFSESHFHKTLLSAKDGKIEVGIGDKAKPIPDSALEEACAAYQAITMELLRYLDGWLHTKQPYEKYT